MSQNSDKAVAMFNQGFNCAQSVLTACGEPLGLPRDTALRVAGPFGGGMGRMGYTCGAVTGALMAIGVKHPITDPADPKPKQQAYKLAQEFMQQFKKRHGSLACRDLLGCDLSTPEGLKEMQDKGLHKTICNGLVRSGAEIVDELLAH